MSGVGKTTKKNVPDLLLPKEVSREPYMSDLQLSFFAEHLRTLHGRTRDRIHLVQQGLRERTEMNDDADLAQYEEESRLALRIVDRETKLLRKIDEALERIRTGDYGYCKETGEPIGLQRLVLRPTAEYCTEVKNQMEQKERHYGKHR